MIDVPCSGVSSTRRRPRCATSSGSLPRTPAPKITRELEQCITGHASVDRLEVGAVLKLGDVGVAGTLDVELEQLPVLHVFEVPGEMVVGAGAVAPGALVVGTVADDLDVLAELVVADLGCSTVPVFGDPPLGAEDLVCEVHGAFGVRAYTCVIYITLLGKTGAGVCDTWITDVSDEGVFEAVAALEDQASAAEDLRIRPLDVVLGQPRAPVVQRLFPEPAAAPRGAWLVPVCRRPRLAPTGNVVTTLDGSALVLE